MNRRELPPVESMSLEELRAEVEGGREAFAAVAEDLEANKTALRALRGTIDALFAIRDERDREIRRLRTLLHDHERWAASRRQP